MTALEVGSKIRLVGNSTEDQFVDLEIGGEYVIASIDYRNKEYPIELEGFFEFVKENEIELIGDTP